MHGPAALDRATLIPYENIVMWTLHLEETCLDLTLDGTFSIDASGQRKIEWWTGSVLELRCCLSSTEATVNLGNQIKEVRPARVEAAPCVPHRARGCLPRASAHF